MEVRALTFRLPLAPGETDMGTDCSTRKEAIASHLRDTACSAREDWLRLLGSGRTEGAAADWAVKQKVIFIGAHQNVGRGCAGA